VDSATALGKGGKGKKGILRTRGLSLWRSSAGSSRKFTDLSINRNWKGKKGKKGGTSKYWRRIDPRSNLCFARKKKEKKGEESAHPQNQCYV